MKSINKTRLRKIQKYLGILIIFCVFILGGSLFKWSLLTWLNPLFPGSLIAISSLLLLAVEVALEDHFEYVPGRKNRKRAEALNVDFIDISVLYKFKRLGDEKLIKFPKVSKKGQFVINGDYMTVGNIAFNKDDIQWLQLYNNSTAIRLDVNIDGWWHQISIDPGYGGMLDELLKRVPKKLKHRRSANRPNIRTRNGKKAHITTQNLQGIFEKLEEVELHVTPLWMVVLQNGRVMQQHFIDDIADIRSTKHPTDLDDDMQLLTFEVGEKAFAYALKDDTFVTRLSDATRDGIDSETMRKKKKQQ